METKNLAESLHTLERKVIVVLPTAIKFEDIVTQSKLSEIEVMRALQWLSNKQLANIEEEIKEVVMLDTNGEKYSKKGLPEKRLLNELSDELKDSEIIFKQAHINEDEKNICIGALRSKAAIEITKQDGKLQIKITSQGKKLLEKQTPEEQFIHKKFPLEIKTLQDLDKLAYDNLKKRKEIIKTEIIKNRKATITQLGKEVLKLVEQSGEVIDSLTPQIIKEGSWKNKNFRRYDIKINVPTIYGGKRHFVNQSVEYIKQIWLDLGFKEMEGTMVQTSFWDLDSLFVPQDHPAREMQDTFYLKDPKHGKLPELYHKIKQVHENGADTGSKGWGGKWSEEKAKELLLRTHTTVLSAQTINKLKKEDIPAKYFSVGKVFRNETLDWKHLFEFNQVEGIVVDPDANLKHLKGYLREFFGKMGYPDVRMRPAHFPYTEPSVEVDVFHPIKKEWVEFGGAGIFRPEVTKPLIGTETPVLAWGLGMPRIIAGYFNITDIRELYKNDLKQIKEMKTWLK